MASYEASHVLTVVIPAYNVAPFIEQCIESVVEQSVKYNIKIILVVDGATDDTAIIVRRLSRTLKYGHFRVIEQKCQGLSVARNNGLAQVESEYVAFLDGDDFWSPHYLATVLPALKERRPDILEYNAQIVDQFGNFLAPLRISMAANIGLREITLNDFTCLFQCYAWARVTKTELVRQYPFPVGRRFEDVASVPWHYWNARSIIGLGSELISYRMRSGSILASPDTQDVLDLATTVRRASVEYLSTRSDYWQVVANRIHQQACRRTLLSPIGEWGRLLRALTWAIDGTPPSRGMFRWIQVRIPLLYLILLRIKRSLEQKTVGSIFT